MFFNRMESGPASISDAVHLEVITGLHGTMMPTILAAACQAMVGAITTYETGDLMTAEAVAGRRQAAQVPDRQENPKQVQIDRIIRLVHVANDNYEFDLAQCLRKIRAIRQWRR